MQHTISCPMLRLSVLALLVSLAAPAALAQSLPAAARAYLGEWTTYSDNSGEAQAVVRLTESNGVVRGRIVRLLPTTQYPVPNFQCDDCKGRYAGADLRTVPLIEGMEWEGDKFGGGRIVDPTDGKSYKATLALDGPNRLRVRGYVLVKALGRTQVWRRTR